jgi:hypothetical protein
MSGSYYKGGKNKFTEIKEYFESREDFSYQDDPSLSSELQYMQRPNPPGWPQSQLPQSMLRPGQDADIMPKSPPPRAIPRRPSTAFRIDPVSIRSCMFKFTYIWQSNGTEYWMFPIQLSRDTVSGFRWNMRFGWSYFGISLNKIDAFMCS